MNSENQSSWLRIVATLTCLETGPIWNHADGDDDKNIDRKNEIRAISSRKHLTSLMRPQPEK